MKLKIYVYSVRNLALTYYSDEKKPVFFVKEAISFYVRTT